MGDVFAIRVNEWKVAIWWILAEIIEILYGLFLPELACENQARASSCLIGWSSKRVVFVSLWCPLSSECLIYGLLAEFWRPNLGNNLAGRFLLWFYHFELPHRNKKTMTWLSKRMTGPLTYSNGPYFSKMAIKLWGHWPIGLACLPNPCINIFFISPSSFTLSLSSWSMHSLSVFSLLRQRGFKPSSLNTSFRFLALLNALRDSVLMVSCSLASALHNVDVSGCVVSLYCLLSELLSKLYQSC